MIRQLILILVLAVALAGTSIAGTPMVVRWHVGGGVVFPSGPDQFYDYWKTGYQVGAGIELFLSSRFHHVITLEGGYFPFDKERFLKRLGLEDGNTSVDGASTFVIDMTFVAKYIFTEYDNLQPAVFAGLGVAGQNQLSATVNYSGYVVTSDAKSSLFLSFPLGASVMLYHHDPNALDLMLCYTIGVANYPNYAGLRLDYSFSL